MGFPLLKDVNVEDNLENPLDMAALLLPFSVALIWLSHSVMRHSNEQRITVLRQSVSDYSQQRSSSVSSNASSLRKPPTPATSDDVMKRHRLPSIASQRRLYTPLPNELADRSPQLRFPAIATAHRLPNGSFVIKSRVPLALRQGLLYVTLCYYFIQCVSYLNRVVEDGESESFRIVAYLSLAVATTLTIVADSFEFRRFRLGRCASPVLPVCLLLITVAQTVLVDGQYDLFAPDRFGLRSVAWLFSWMTWLTTLVQSCLRLGTELSSEAPNPEQLAYDLHDILLFLWYTPILDAGADLDKQVEAEDLPPLMRRDTAEHNNAEFQRILGDTERRDYDRPRRLWYKLWILTWPWFIGAGVAQIFAFFTPYVQILSLNLVLDWLEHVSDDDDANPNFVTKAAFFGLFFGPFLSACSQVVQNTLNRRVAIRARAAMQQLIYRKAMRMDLSAQDSKIGEIVNLMSVDTNNILNAVSQIHYIWVVFPQFAISVVGLDFIIGKAWLAALVLMIAVVPIYIVGFGRYQKLQVQVLQRKDERMDVISEVLHGVRIIKMCAMEPGFLAKVEGRRVEELGVLRRLLGLMVVLITVVFTTPSLMILATFITHTAILDRRLSASVGFTTIALMDQFRASMTILPWVGQQLFMAAASLKRVNEFLGRSEVIPVPKHASSQFDHHGGGDNDNDECVIRIDRGTFIWGGSLNHRQRLSVDQSVTQSPLLKPKPAKPVEASLLEPLLEEDEGDISSSFSSSLNSGAASMYGESSSSSSDDDDGHRGGPALVDVSLRVRRGSLVCVYGATGGGKSSLLSALLGEILKLEGDVFVAGSVAYTPQKAWSQNATIRANILFGKPFTPEARQRYDRVVEACALKKDFEELAKGRPHGFEGDQTEIGEKGITLSGGQQQRVALARAAYSDADIYLLDDPLSAVDSHVGKQLFQRCILGLLAGKTRVLVTHQVALTHRHADWIVVMGGNGRILEQGTPQQLLAQGLHFRELLSVTGQSTAAEQSEEEKYESQLSEQKEASELGQASSRKQAAAVASDVAGPVATAGRLVEDEDRQQGAPKWEVYKRYVQACGGWSTITWVAVLAVGTPVIGLLSYLALTQWINSMDQGSNPEGLQMWFYVGATVLYMLNFAMRFSYQNWAGLRASMSLHGEMMARVLRAPPGWFDRTPVGRILNRFSSDMQSIDREAISNVMTFISCALMPLVAAVTIGSLPGFYPLYGVMAVVIFVAIRTALQYLRSARELKRLDSTVKSPLYAHFNESLNGLSTLRAFDGASDRFSAQSMKKINNVNLAELYLWAAQRWMAFRLNCLSAFVSGSTGLFIYLTAGSVSPAGAGLALTYCASFTGYMMAAINAEATMEMSMNAVERVGEYCQLPQEAPAVIESTRPPSSWPEDGEILAESVCLRYGTSSDLIIKDLSFHISPRSSVGIVGRTGAGKSTLSIALLRMLEAQSGRFLIDGVDISTIGLQDLRNAVAVVPQDPVLFTGTVRFNLDPFERYTDAQVRDALRRVQLTEDLHASPSHSNNSNNSSSDLLSFQLTEGGGNLSVGERQLVCLARALLRSSRILVMDEATANVDPETDSKIQRVIRDELSNATVLTVAHRINTIIYYDRIMVLESGHLAEFGSPADLLAKKGLFYELCFETGDLDALTREAELKQQRGNTG